LQNQWQKTRNLRDASGKGMIEAFYKEREREKYREDPVIRVIRHVWQAKAH